MTSENPKPVYKDIFFKNLFSWYLKNKNRSNTFRKGALKWNVVKVSSVPNSSENYDANSEGCERVESQNAKGTTDGSTVKAVVASESHKAAVSYTHRHKSLCYSVHPNLNLKKKES